MGVPVIPTLSFAQHRSTAALGATKELEAIKQRVFKCQVRKPIDGAFLLVPAAAVTTGSAVGGFTLRCGQYLVDTDFVQEGVEEIGSRQGRAVIHVVAVDGACVGVCGIGMRACMCMHVCVYTSCAYFVYVYVYMFACSYR